MTYVFAAFGTLNKFGCTWVVYQGWKKLKEYHLFDFGCVDALEKSAPDAWR